MSNLKLRYEKRQPTKRYSCPNRNSRSKDHEKLNHTKPRGREATLDRKSKMHFFLDMDTWRGNLLCRGILKPKYEYIPTQTWSNLDEVSMYIFVTVMEPSFWKRGWSSLITSSGAELAYVASNRSKRGNMAIRERCGHSSTSIERGQTSFTKEKESELEYLRERSEQRGDTWHTNTIREHGDRSRHIIQTNRGRYHPIFVYPKKKKTINQKLRHPDLFGIFPLFFFFASVFLSSSSFFSSFIIRGFGGVPTRGTSRSSSSSSSREAEWRREIERHRKESGRGEKKGSSDQRG